MANAKCSGDSAAVQVPILQYIGHDGQQVVNSAQTRRQIDQLKACRCALVSPDGREPVSWFDLDNPDEPRTLLQCILGDRRIRVDQQTFMADRPPIAVATVLDGVCVRFEFYEGHDALSKTFDLRSSEWRDKELADWMDHDPQAYDPLEFLKSAGISDNWVKPLLDAVHQETER
jgi:hypothetical protein